MCLYYDGGHSLCLSATERVGKSRRTREWETNSREITFLNSIFIRSGRAGTRNYYSVTWLLSHLWHVTVDWFNRLYVLDFAIAYDGSQIAEYWKSKCRSNGDSGGDAATFGCLKINNKISQMCFPSHLQAAKMKDEKLPSTKEKTSMHTIRNRIWNSVAVDRPMAIFWFAHNKFGHFYWTIFLSTRKENQNKLTSCPFLLYHSQSVRFLPTPGLVVGVHLSV